MRKLFVLLIFILFYINFASAVIIFNEDFESGTLGNWVLSSPDGRANWTANQTNPFEGSWHANSQPRSTTEPASVIVFNKSMTGYSNITLRYYRRLVGIDAADEFQFEFYTGANWTILESTAGNSANDASYLFREFNLSNVANNLSGFAIKFECTAGAVNEHCRVDNISIIGTDNNPPLIALLSPVNGTNVSTNFSSFLAHFEDNFNATNATLYIWNNTELVTTNFTLLGNTSISANLSFMLPREGDYFWNYFACDFSNNCKFNNTNFTLTFSLPVIDVIPPNVTNLIEFPADPATYSFNAVYLFNATIVDNTAIGKVIFSFNGSNYSATNVSNNYTVSISGLSAGTYGYYWWVNDTSGNVNNSQSGTYAINKAAGVVNLYLNNSRNNITIFQGSSILLNATLINGSGNILLYNNGNLINSGSGNLSNLTNFGNVGTFNITTIYSGNENYTSAFETFYIFVIDGTAPVVNIVYPNNGTTYNGNVTALNYTVSDAQLQSCWYSLNNGVANATIICGQNITGINANEGGNTWRVYANDSAGNLGLGLVIFNVNLPVQIRCEVGGSYQQGALVLLQGNVSNSTSPINNLSVNASVYNSQNVLNVSKILATASDGSYETTFSNLSVGSYTINVSAVYNNLSSSCVDNLQVGSSAVFVLDKVISIFNLSNDSISYSVALRLNNLGGSAAVNVNITDFDSPNQVYLIGNLSAGSFYELNYTKVFTRQNSITYYLFNQSISRGIDSYNNNLISANSTLINVTIPAVSQGVSIVIVKNVVFVSENSTAVIYNVSSTLHNSGDLDLIDLSYIDTDIQGNSILVNLTVGQSRQFSNLKTIAKAASNTQHQFALGTAVIGTQSFYSNQPTVNIPGYGGPADIIVYAPAQVNSGISFDSIVEVRNINPDIGQDLAVDYWISSNDETVNYSSGQQTVFVSANSSNNITATLTSPSIVGTYRLRALVTWIGGTAGSFDSFDVVSAGGGTTGSSGGGGSSTVTGAVIEETTPEVPSQKQPKCNPPYIESKGDCCLDENKNYICDAEELLKQPAYRPTSGRFLTGFFIFDNFEIFSKVFMLVFIFVILLVLLLLFYALKKSRAKEKGLMRLSYLGGMNVYIDSGYLLGKITDVLLNGNKIDSLKVRLIKKYKINGIVIPYKFVEAVSEIVLVKEAVLNEIGKHE